MTVELNGIRAELPERSSVADAVRLAGADPDGRGVAVAIAGEVVPRSQWGERFVRDGESIEVVHAVQGG